MQLPAGKYVCRVYYFVTENHKLVLCTFPLHAKSPETIILKEFFIVFHIS
jgi:3-hydroxymyristoyl/3-hydroxydecanoyl-(acyl carrier protein) dehydratase